MRRFGCPQGNRGGLCAGSPSGWATEPGDTPPLGRVPKICWRCATGLLNAVSRTSLWRRPESYWKPVYYVLEEGFTLLLVNAAHVKQVPGRKSDVADCAWLAQLLEHGLLRASFVPPRPIRELRDLTRLRKSLIQDRTRAANRLHKVLQDAGLKLSSVATDVLGASGRVIRDN
jgi:hypothetical protein